ncbi:hypothetical protein AcW1_007902 [Taiwanofungus camphoratus]|nr:hypothetical protein AcW2_007041 [Antrodia cinnamomea]KAI0953763.1 hypothetical protein AcW1_007902 [Antrodia cinnamomea]
MVRSLRERRRPQSEIYLLLQRGGPIRRQLPSAPFVVTSPAGSPPFTASANPTFSDSAPLPSDSASISSDSTPTSSGSDPGTTNPVSPASSDASTSATNSSSGSAGSTASSPSLSSTLSDTVPASSSSSSSSPNQSSSSPSPSITSNSASSSFLGSSSSPLSTPFSTVSPSSSAFSLISTSTPTLTSTPSFTSSLSAPSSSSSTSSLTSESAHTTIYSAIVTTISGTETTIYTAIPTMLSSPESTTSTSTNRGIIAGSTVGAVAFLALALALVLFYRRHQNKKLSFFRRKQPRPRNLLLAGEDIEDYDLGPPMQHYQDYPGSLTSHSRADSYTTRSVANSPVPLNVSPENSMHPRYTPSPHLLGLRASESGSIFQEAVWPPPKALVDPLVSSSSDDLSRIVDDIMGPVPRSSNARESIDTGPRSSASMRRAAGQGSVVSLNSSAHASHTRATSQTALMSDRPDSPVSPTWRSPLFVTNMGAGSASPTSPASPPLGARSRLPHSPPKILEDVEDSENYSMGEAI